MKGRVRRLGRPNMRRAVVLFPSGLTLGNLFFGVFAIIAASRDQFVAAGVYVLLGGICDALDGQVARATNAGTQFGEELDSLVDAITFGLAPGLIMYFAVLNRDNWDWLAVFLFAACAVMRLARFNIEQAGTAKTYFQGLPSPAAGITLASYYWFSQSWLYNYGAIADLPWHALLRYLMAALGFLMISNIPYPVFPRTGFRSLRALGATVLLVGSLALLVTKRLEFFFPIALCYVAWGPLRWVFSGLFERRQPTIPYDLSEGEDDEEEEDDVFGPIDSQVHASRQSERELRVPREEREPVSVRRDRPERPERTARPDRAARPDRGKRADGSAAPPAESVAIDQGSSRSERAVRPERTESERAARREKREKREIRRERPRSETASEPAAAESGIAAITVGAGGEPAEAPLLSVVRADSDIVPIEDAENAPIEGGVARKRKRRRRRGQRDRAPGEAGAAGDAGESGDDADDAFEPGDHGPDRDSEADAGSGSEDPAERRPGRQPEPAAEARPPEPPTRIVPPSPYRADGPAPSDPDRPPTAPSSTEPSA